MQLLHHQIAMREDDGEFVCRRCGLVNPGEDEGCIPVNLEPPRAEIPRRRRRPERAGPVSGLKPRPDKRGIFVSLAGLFGIF